LLIILQRKLARFLRLEQFCDRMLNRYPAELSRSRGSLRLSRDSELIRPALWGEETQYLATVHRDRHVEPCGVGLRHPPNSGFGNLDQPLITDNEIQVGVETQAVDSTRR
jgi:hypothetical protein